MIDNLYTPNIKQVEEEGNFSKFEIEPLSPGYGMTLGNSIRRVILSSLEGAAITEIQIEGVAHEYSTIDGVIEDVVDIILNIKSLRVKYEGDEPVTITLDAKGKNVLTAKDIEVSNGVEIINKDQHIATLDAKDASMSMTMKVERGLGYVPVEERTEATTSIGTIAIDALFTPIRKVNYAVENARVGQKTNLDKLVIELETDGTVNPLDAVRLASGILVDQFKAVSGDLYVEKTVEEEEEEINDISVDELNFTPRTSNALANNSITTIGEVLEKTDDELIAMKGFGLKALNEVKDKIKELEEEQTEDELIG